MGNTEPARSTGHNISSLEILKLLNPFGMRKNCNSGANVPFILPTLGV
jgi:hypothetical protein